LPCNGAKDQINGGPDRDVATIDRGKDVVTEVEVAHFC